MKVKVIIEEIISQTFEVEVSDMSNAYEEIKEKYRKEELVLNDATMIGANIAFLDENEEASEFVELC